MKLKRAIITGVAAATVAVGTAGLALSAPASASTLLEAVGSPVASIFETIGQVIGSRGGTAEAGSSDWTWTDPSDAGPSPTWQWPGIADQPSSGTGDQSGTSGGNATWPGADSQFPGWFEGDTADQTADSTTTAATDVESTGVVLINTEVNFGEGAAAGTGMVIDEDGLVVTNHHVVADSTEVTVTIPTTDETYDAKVLGYDASVDVALLELVGADDLDTVTIADDPAVIGQSITAVGNADGEGQLMAGQGSVTALEQSITVQDEMDGSSSTLSGLIEMDAPIVAGDSGGAVIDDQGDVVAMNVAGTTGSATEQNYAIAIDDVMAIVESVIQGQATDSIIIGRTAALGIYVSSNTAAVEIVGLMADGPAEASGLTTGSTITGINGQTVASRDDLTSILAGLAPDQTVTVVWTDAAGSSHSADMTLAAAPLA